MVATRLAATTLCIFISLLALTSLSQDTPDFALFPSHTLEFPMVVEDMKTWKTVGAAVMGKNKMHLNPEVKQRQGLLYNTELFTEKEWILDVEFAIGNSQSSTFGTNGMGIFILQEILSKEIDNVSMFGYSHHFIGAAVYLNTGLRKKDPQTQARLEGVQGVVSDGSKGVNTWEIPTEDTCFYKYRQPVDAEGNPTFSSIRLHYNHEQLDILYYDTASESYEHCFNLDIKIPSGAYIVLSASSGVWDEDYHIVKSIRAMNPNKFDKSHHAEQSKLLKGQKYMEKLQTAGDVMHKNRLRYKDKSDLVKKVNHEITTFSLQSKAIENYIIEKRQKRASKNGNQGANLDVERLHSDLDGVVKDFNIIDKMINYTYTQINQIEQRTKSSSQNQQNKQPQRSEEKSNRIIELEEQINSLQNRLDTVQARIQTEKKDIQQQNVIQDRKKRAQMSEARMKSQGNIPRGFMTKEIQQQLEDTQAEIRQKTSGGGYFKTFLVWAALISIAGFILYMWKNIDETEKKYKH